MAVGLVGFFGPFFGATLVAHFLVGWGWRASWLGVVALSTTSVAVVYAVMLELGFNQTTYGKAILAAASLMTWELGGLAVWSGSEAVLPVYLIGMVLLPCYVPISTAASWIVIAGWSGAAWPAVCAWPVLRPGRRTHAPRLDSRPIGFTWRGAPRWRWQPGRTPR
jgi:hypothetical protein